jgi:hypothetical protein
MLAELGNEDNAYFQRSKYGAVCYRIPPALILTVQDIFVSTVD